MKSIKTFEEFEYEDPEIESELGVLPYENVEISAEKLKKMLDDALSTNDMDLITRELVIIRKKYNPKENHKDIWWSAVRKWYDMFKTLGHPSNNLIMKGFN